MIVKIIPTPVALGVLADGFDVQVLTFNLAPDTLPCNGKFYKDGKEVANVPFELSKDVYENWLTDQYLIEQSMLVLGLKQDA